MSTTAVDGHVFQTTTDFSPVIERPLGNVYNFLGAAGELAPGPQGYLVEQLPGTETDAHFHPVDQYQVMFGSPGAYYLRHPIPVALLHYADAYSVYGPFGAGSDESMSYLTLRGASTNLHGSMPKSRDQLLYRGERQHKVDLEPLLHDGTPPEGDVVVDTLIDPQGDGLAAYLVRTGPGTEAVPPGGELRTGRYTVVLHGELHLGGRAYGPKSVGWSSGDTSDIVVRGGPDGFAALFLYLPYPATPSLHLSKP